LELAPVGHLVLWLGVSLVAVGILLFNTLILLPAAFLFMCLLFEGVLFHRALNLVTDSIKLESYPRAIETIVGEAFKVETVLTNSSNSRLRIARFSHNLPPHFFKVDAPILGAESRAKQHFETLLTTSIPGRAEITRSTILLEDRAHLFCNRTEFSDKVIITAHPLVGRRVDPIETGVLSDLTVDHLRRGAGTDLAGIRPFYMLDDFHSIDWKATARTGKLMTRESYLERDPTIMLMIDVSMSTRGHGSSVLEAFLSEAGNLLKAIGPATPLGLILYDKRSVIANIEAMQGVNSREKILRTLLEKAETTPARAPLERRAIRGYPGLARETNALIRESAIGAKTKAHWERLSLLTSFILPFYQRAESKFFERLKRQGVFKAFEIICAFPEPALMIVISDGETNFDGLVEGAKNARMLNHKVVLVIIEVLVQERIEMLSALQDLGVGTLICRPKELSQAINAEILSLSHSRTIQVEGSR
jgi:uncharacterized protein (DUF58 family)